METENESEIGKELLFLVAAQAAQIVMVIGFLFTLFFLAHWAGFF